MRFITTILFAALTCCGSFTFAQEAQTSTAIVSPTVPNEIQITLAPIVPGSVQVAEPAAPPKWAEDLIMKLQSMPVVGPYVSKIMVYLGILCAILTGLLAFLLTSLTALSGVLNFAGLTDAVKAIEDFKSSKFMYWLKYFSMFNAKKEKPK